MQSLPPVRPPQEHCYKGWMHRVAEHGPLGALTSPKMKIYLANRWFRFGFWLALIGGMPLGAILLLAAVGLWPDPNPNPIGPGLLFFLTFWPAVICMGIGAFQAWRRRK